MTNRLLGKTAIITGAAQGIGLSIAQCFAAEGARGALVDVKVEQGKAAAELLRAGGSTTVLSSNARMSPIRLQSRA